MDDTALGVQIVNGLKDTVDKKLKEGWCQPLSLQSMLELKESLSHGRVDEARVCSLRPFQLELVDVRADEL